MVGGATRRARRAALAAAVVLGTLGLASAGASATPPKEDWVGWGVHVEFSGVGPIVDYTAYAGRNATASKPAKVVASLTTRLPAGSCSWLSGDVRFGASFAEFRGGGGGISCDLPSWAVQLASLGYAAGPTVTTTTPGVAPLFGGAGVVLPKGAGGTFTVMDASALGYRSSVVSNGRKAHGRLELARPLGAGTTSYDSPAFRLHKGGDAFAMDLGGEQTLAVVGAFPTLGSLGFLSNPGWQGFFETHATPNVLASWIESPPPTAFTGLLTTTQPYELGTQADTITIGASTLPSGPLGGEGTVRLHEADGDPGSTGI